MTHPDRPIIMLVDDDTDLLALLETALLAEGYAVDVRASAPSRQDIAAVDPSLIFLDVGLLEENGAALCRAIKEDFGPTLPVVLISGHDDDQLHQEAALAHADACLTKPFGHQVVRALAAYYAPVPASEDHPVR